MARASNTRQDPALERAMAMLDSPVSVHRAMAARELARMGIGGAIPRLKSLLEDSSPYTFRHGSTLMLAEVRSAALVALEQLYRQVGLRPDFGLLNVRKAMPAIQAAAMYRDAVAAMSKENRDTLSREIDAILSSRIRPDVSSRDALRAYVALQNLGLVEYSLEQVDPDTYLTPTQAAVSATQTRNERPFPHLRVLSDAVPPTILGYVYKLPEQRRWILDFAEDPQARRAAAFVRSLLRMERDTFPGVRRDIQGQPITSADGSFVLYGSLALESCDPAELLRSLEAFVRRRYPYSLVQQEPTPPAQGKS